MWNFLFDFLFLFLFLYDYHLKNKKPKFASKRLEVTYANNNNLIKKFENMPTPEPLDNGLKKSSGKKAVGVKKSLVEKSRGLITGGKGKEVVNTDAYF